MPNGCPSCGGAALRVLPFATTFADVAYFRCATCGDVWTIGVNKSEAARRITHGPHTHAPEQAIIFTCPECNAPLTLDRVVVGQSVTTVTFGCSMHGHFTLTDQKGLTPARIA